MNFIEHVFGGRKGLKAHTKTLGKTYPFSFQLSLASLVVLWGSTRIRISGRMSGWERVLFVLCIHFFIPCPLLKNHRVILWFGLRIPCPLSGFVVIYLIGNDGGRLSSFFAWGMQFYEGRRDFVFEVLTLVKVFHVNHCSNVVGSLPP